jgi:TonB family protein
MPLDRRVGPWLLLAAALHVAAMAQAQERPPTDNGVIPARLDMSTCALPTYPKASLDAEETGKTMVRLRVDPAGALTVSLEKSSGYERLDRATIEALGRCRATPGMRDGAKAESTFTVEYVWRIKPQILIGGCVPEYPAAALKIEAQGTTTLQFTVDDKGALTDAAISKSSGHEVLDRAALSALSKCRFKPAVTAGQTQKSSTFTVEYVWRLADEVTPPVAPPVAPDPFLPRL